MKIYKMDLFFGHLKQILQGQDLTWNFDLTAPFGCAFDHMLLWRLQALDVGVRVDVKHRPVKRQTCSHKIHPPVWCVCTSYTTLCTLLAAMTTVFELVRVIPCYDSPEACANRSPHWRTTVTNIHLQVFTTLRPTKSQRPTASNLWQWFLQTTCWCRAKPSTLLIPWMFCAR